MKKNFKYYAIGWATLLILFNVIAFVSVGWQGTEKYTPSFWIGYVFITVCFLGQLVISYFALNQDTLKKTFYNISVVKTSYSGLIASFVFGSLCMLISPLPYWVGVLLCAIILAANVLTVVKSKAAAEIVTEVDEKIKTQTFFIKSITADAEGLLSRAQTPEAKEVTKKIYEAFRYSDPMSNDALTEIEKMISSKFSDFSNAVTVGDENMARIADELAALIGDRNRKCKLLK